MLAVLVALLIGAGLVRTVLWARGGSRTLGARLLLAWTVGPVVALSLGVIPVAAQYWTVLLPLPALYLALGLEGGGTWLARRVSPRAVAAGMAAVACVVALCWVGSYGALLRAVDAGAGARAFGVPLARWQQVLTATRESAARLGTQEVRVAVAWRGSGLRQRAGGRGDVARQPAVGAFRCAAGACCAVARLTTGPASICGPSKTPVRKHSSARSGS